MSKGSTHRMFREMCISNPNKFEEEGWGFPSSPGRCGWVCSLFVFLGFFLLLLLLLMMMMMMMMIFRIPFFCIECGQVAAWTSDASNSGARCKLFPCPPNNGKIFLVPFLGLKVSGVKMTHHSHNHSSSFASYSCLWTLDSPFLFPSFQFCQPNMDKILLHICCFLPFDATATTRP